MPKTVIEEFAEILVREVRDEAIRACDRLYLNSESKDDAERKMLIANCVDEAIGYLLLAIDQGRFQLRFVASGGRVIDLVTEGDSELCGWYMGSGGWRAAYAKERFVDYFKDLTL